jgi:hypothetical protein
VQALRENPALLEAIGLDPLGDVPSIERFSDWLSSIPYGAPRCADSRSEPSRNSTAMRFTACPSIWG